MSTDQEAKRTYLVPSLNPGRYVVGDAHDGPDLTTGVEVEVFIGAIWHQGQVWHSQTMPSNGMYAITDGAARGVFAGYYVLLTSGDVIGLCSGMQVRIVRRPIV